MQNLRAGSRESQLRAVAVYAGVVSEALGVAAEADLVVGLVEASKAGYDFRFVVALESRPRNHVEHAVGTVAVFGGIAASLDFERINIFGIKLRADVRRDIRIGNRHAIY